MVVMEEKQEDPYPILDMVMVVEVEDLEVMEEMDLVVEEEDILEMVEISVVEEEDIIVMEEMVELITLAMEFMVAEVAEDIVLVAMALEEISIKMVKLEFV